MDVFKNNKFDNSDIQVSNDDYRSFISRNIDAIRDAIKEELKGHSDVYKTDTLTVVCENDVNVSYIMIDANGWLVDDIVNDSYVPLIDCAVEDFEEGLKKMNFDSELFFSVQVTLESHYLRNVRRFIATVAGLQYPWIS